MTNLKHIDKVYGKELDDLWKVFNQLEKENTKKIHNLERKVNNIFNYVEYKEKEEKELYKLLDYVDWDKYIKDYEIKKKVG